MRVTLCTNCLRWDNVVALFHSQISITTDCTGIATEAVSQIQQNLRFGTGNIQHTGSSYEGNATKNNSDYDMMIDVAPKGSTLQAESAGKPGFNKLKYQQGSAVHDPSFCEKFLTADGNYSARSAVQEVCGFNDCLFARVIYNVYTEH